MSGFVTPLRQWMEGGREKLQAIYRLRQFSLQSHSKGSASPGLFNKCLLVRSLCGKREWLDNHCQTGYKKRVLLRIPRFIKRQLMAIGSLPKLTLAECIGKWFLRAEAFCQKYIWFPRRGWWITFPKHPWPSPSIRQYFLLQYKGVVCEHLGFSTCVLYLDINFVFDCVQLPQRFENYCPVP